MRFPEELMDVYNQYDRFVSGDVNGYPAWDIIKSIEKQFPVDDLMLKDGTRIWNLIRIFIYTFYPEMTRKRSSGFKKDFLVFFLHLFFKKPKMLNAYIFDEIVVSISDMSGVDEESIRKSLYSYIIVFKEAKHFFYKKYSRSGIHDVFLDCGYGRIPMAKAQACRELGIRCTERQHGVIDEFFPAYVRETPTKNHDCVPEYLNTYDELFTEIVRKGYLFLPDKVKTVGYPIINKYILVSSQWILSEEIRDFIINTAAVLPEKYLILFQPHSLDPANYDDLERENIILVDKNMDIDVLFRSTDVHATVFSGRGYYANVYDIPTVYIDIRDIVTVDSPFVVKTPEEFIEALEKII